jgi:hypothetical protein
MSHPVVLAVAGHAGVVLLRRCMLLAAEWRPLNPQPLNPKPQTKPHTLTFRSPALPCRLWDAVAEALAAGSKHGAWRTALYAVRVLQSCAASPALVGSAPLPHHISHLLERFKPALDAIAGPGIHSLFTAKHSGYSQVQVPPRSAPALDSNTPQSPVRGGPGSSVPPSPTRQQPGGTPQSPAGHDCSTPRSGIGYGSSTPQSPATPSDNSSADSRRAQQEPADKEKALRARRRLFGDVPEVQQPPQQAKPPPSAGGSSSRKGRSRRSESSSMFNASGLAALQASGLLVLGTGTDDERSAYSLPAFALPSPGPQTTSKKAPAAASAAVSEASLSPARAFAGSSKAVLSSPPSAKLAAAKARAKRRRQRLRPLLDASNGSLHDLMYTISSSSDATESEGEGDRAPSPRTLRMALGSSRLGRERRHVERPGAARAAQPVTPQSASPSILSSSRRGSSRMRRGMAVPPPASPLRTAAAAGPAGHVVKPRKQRTSQEGAAEAAAPKERQNSRWVSCLCFGA